jgi:hypothetical protein
MAKCPFAGGTGTPAGTGINENTWRRLIGVSAGKNRKPRVGECPEHQVGLLFSKNWSAKALTGAGI